ncbi:hypothetical protein EPUL_006328, partial [Erysiphe pulchra]
ELAEIFIARQRQERAWQIRLLVCTSFISGIESTVASSHDGNEKEIAKTIQTYLRNAISEFAASETTPLLSKGHLTSNTIKILGNMKTNLPPKPTAFSITSRISKGQTESSIQPANSHTPNNTPTAGISWSSVVRNGNKKSRTTPVPKLQTTPAILVNKNSVQPTFNNTNKSTSHIKEPNAKPEDKRLFIRLPVEHEWRKLSPAGIREIVFKKFSISSTLIGTIKPVRSGFALSPRNNDTQTASNWIPIMIPTVPVSIGTEKGRVEVTKEMLADEIERVTSVRPSSLRLYGRNFPNAPRKTWMAYFTKARRPGFRVFDESGLTRKLNKQQPINFCKRCNGHHSQKTCSRAPSCGNCGSKIHSEDMCMAFTKCINCGGPHRSDSRKCLARPTRNGQPTKEQLKAFQQAGDREFQAVARAKAAEAKADNIENNMETTNNQLKL